MTAILVVNCNTSTTISETIGTAARAAAHPDTRIEVLTPSTGVTSAEGFLDAQLAAVGMLRAVRDHRGPRDAIVLAGFGESGREAMREIVEVPVVDITDAAAQLALHLGPRYGVVTTQHRAVVPIEDSLVSAGVAAHCRGVIAADLPVLETDRLDLGPDGPLARAGAELLARGAEVLVLGCAGFAGAGEELSRALGVPVVDPVAAGVVVAESLIRLGLETSRVNTLAAPLPKARPGWDVAS